MVRLTLCQDGLCAEVGGAEGGGITLWGGRGGEAANVLLYECVDEALLKCACLVSAYSYSWSSFRFS